MKKEYRIKKNDEIAAVAMNKSSVGNKHFIIYKKTNHEMEHFRYAVSVGKKFGSAVKRNQMKRRLRAIISEQSNRLTNKDILLVAKPTSNQLEYIEIKKQILYLLEKAKLYKEE